MVLMELTTGDLDIHVRRAVFPPEELTGFAARNNPRRGFLFVSKVLGKHWPVRPSLMQQTHRALAAAVAAHSPRGPFFVTGMAETATALGRGVFEELCATPSGIACAEPEGVYCHTTRYRLARCEALCFAEEHSHATRHWLHLPQEPADRAVLHAARTLILVDDEMSTGKTLCNMVAVLAARMPQLDCVFVVTLMDLAGQEGQERIRRNMPCETHFVSLLEGSYTFHPRAVLPSAPARSEGDDTVKDHLLPHAGGRTGVRPGGGPVLHFDRRLLRGPRLLVLGTGEFMYEPYRLALALEAEGRDVRFQATTRSPILLGHAIASTLSFVDNYGENIDNFLHNVDVEHYDDIMLCYENAEMPPAHDLPRRLRAHCCHLAP